MPLGTDDECLPPTDALNENYTDSLSEREMRVCADSPSRDPEDGYSSNNHLRMAEDDGEAAFNQDAISEHLLSGTQDGGGINDDRDAELATTEPTKGDLLRSTRLRHGVVATTCLLYILSVALSITAQLGSTSSAPASSNIFLFQLDLSSVILPTGNNTKIINSTARSVGLHDFYRIGLWGFCKGYFDTGVTSCSRPRILFWFNPHQVFLGELLKNSTITLPETAAAMLKVLRFTSKTMFGTLFVGAILDCVLLLGTPVVLFSRWWSLPVSTIAVLSTLSTFMGASIATGVAIAIKVGLYFQKEVNIGNRIGASVIVFMWVSAAIGLAALILHCLMGYGIASIRDVRTGRAPLILEKTQDNSDHDKKTWTGQSMGLLRAVSVAEGEARERSVLGASPDTMRSRIQNVLHRASNVSQ